jgi:NAD(P)-dependent dehydrogenase (short-subunit alcohol dehydrogenase family)
MTSLSKRKVLLTGATGTLGRAVAEACAQAGADLLLNARESEPLAAFATELGATHSVVVHHAPCNLSRSEDVEALAAEARRCFGGLDVLINAAAVLGPIGAAREVEWNQWLDTLSVNLIAAARLSGLCVPLMPISDGRAKIINISGGGATSPRPRFAPYAAAKAAIVRFSETLAIEVRDRGIDVNCIAPGIMSSRLTQAVVDAGIAGAGLREYEAAASVIGGEGDNRHRAAQLAVFLGSTASDGITGRLFSAVWDEWESIRADSPSLNSAEAFTLRRMPAATVNDREPPK